MWCEDWENWTPEDFLEHIVLVFLDKKTSSDKSSLERIGGITLESDLFNPLVGDVILQDMRNFFSSSVLLKTFENALYKSLDLLL